MVILIDSCKAGKPFRFACCWPGQRSDQFSIIWEKDIQCVIVVVVVVVSFVGFVRSWCVCVRLRLPVVQEIAFHGVPCQAAFYCDEPSHIVC